MASATSTKTVLQNYINAFLTGSKNERMRERKQLKPGQRLAPRWDPFDARQEKLVTVLDTNYKIVANARYRALTGKKTIEQPVSNDVAIDCLFSVVDRAQDDLDDLTAYDNGLVRHALTVFINNHLFAISLGLKTPSLTKSEPHIMLPGFSLPLNGPESRMDWWREDPGVNEHHNHWHAIYTTNGIADPVFPNPNFAYTKDRQGELFVWMHKQMLARYDAERIAVGLDPVVPLSNYYDPIPEGYLPNKYLSGYDANTPETELTNKFDYRLPYSPIDATMTLFGNSPGIQQVDTWVASIKKGIDDGVFFNDPDKLGRTIDPDRIDPDKFEDDEWKDKYGRLHASGHMLIAAIVGNRAVHDALKAKNISRVPQGAMGNLATACRDPAFYRWHRFVDELFNSCSEKSKPRVFSDLPAVTIKSADILLAFKDQLVKADPAGENDRWKTYGEKNFGKPDFPATNELQTTMRKREVQGLPNEEKFELEYVFPREFYYFFRVKNNNTVDRYDEENKAIMKVAAEKFVTIRVFIVPDVLSHDRKQWIELDKFKVTLKAGEQPGEETIISRACELSSVIRKPAQKEFPGTSTDDFDNDYCGCGWPYNLLLPRGTREGMKFKLFVFISDWNADKTPESTVEGSLSMCGKALENDQWAKYPDSRDMGYPFDRPYVGSSLQATFSNQAALVTADVATMSFPPRAASSKPEDFWLDNVVMRDLTIRWVDQFDDTSGHSGSPGHRGPPGPPGHRGPPGPPGHRGPPGHH